MSRTSKIDHRETELTSGRNSSKRKGKVQEQEGENEEDELNLNETDTLLPSKSLLLLPEEKKLLTSSLVDDIYAVFYDVKFFAPLSALLFGVLGILIVLDPFTSSPQRPNPMSQTEYALTRPVLTKEEMANIYVNTFYGETIFELPEPYHDTVSLRFQTTATKFGHFQPPEIFYSGVIFGITSDNSHNSVFSNRRLLLDSKSDEEYQSELYQDLLHMDPKPTKIFPRMARNNQTNWKEFGYAVHFDLQDLEAQGYLSSDSHAPWKRTLQPILKIARKYRQIYVTQWAPSQFGTQDPSQLGENKHLHETLVRQIIPTRTGLNNIKSTGAVWLWLRNGNEVTIEETVIRKEWTEEDHWTHYPTEMQKQQQKEKEQQFEEKEIKFVGTREVDATLF